MKIVTSSILYLLIFILCWNCSSNNRTGSENSKAAIIEIENEKNNQDEGIPENGAAASNSSESSNELNTIRAAVLKDDSWQFINQKGELISSADFTFVDNYSDGFACASKNGYRDGNLLYGGSYYFMDTDFKKQSMNFSEQTSFYEDRAVVTMDNGFKAIWSTDKKVVRSGFKQLTRFHEGLAAAKKGDTIGYVNKQGEWAIQLEPSMTIGSFSDGLAKVKTDSLMGYVNKEGEWEIEPKVYDDVGDFHEGLAKVKKDGLYGYIDKEGSIVIPIIYEGGAKFSEGLAKVKYNEKYGFIDTIGNQVTEFKYMWTRSFKNGLAAVSTDNVLGGYINTKGETIIEEQFKGLFDFYNGLAIVQIDQRMGYIDRNGILAIPAIYTRANNFVNVNETNGLFQEY